MHEEMVQRRSHVQFKIRPHYEKTKMAFNLLDTVLSGIWSEVMLTNEDLL